MRDIDVGQVVVVAVGVLEVVVRRLVVVHEKKRFVIIPTLLEPLQGLVGHGIGRVHAIELDQILGPWFLSSDTKLGIVILSLPRQDAVKVEGGRFHLEVPLADHGSVVSRLLHFLGEVLSLSLDAST